MSRNADPLDQRLREIDPGAGAFEDEAAPEALLRSILASDHPAAGAAGRPQRALAWRRRRILAPFAVAAAAALALAIGLPGGSGRDGGDGAVAALDNVAAAAAAEPPAPRLPYLYLETRSLSVDTASAGGEIWSVHHAELREEWSAPDGSGHVRVKVEAPSFVGPGDRAAWEAAGSPNFLAHGFAGSSSEEDVPAGSFEAAGDLPTDPDLLARRLRSEAEEGHGSAPLAARMLELIAEDLRNPAVAPEQRAALYRAAQEVPGLEYLGRSTDPEGRQGVAVGISSGYSGGPTTYSLVYDPRSTDVLAYEVEAQGPVAYADSEGPLVISATVYLKSAAVASLPR